MNTSPTLQFVAYGVPAPKGSARAFVPKGWTRAVVTAANPKTKGWQQTVAEAASAELLRTGGAQFDGPVLLQVAFALPRPVSLPKRVQHHTKKPDLDKLIRSVKDALSKVAWRDDSQVVSVTATKRYAVDCAPHALVVIQEAE